MPNTFQGFPTVPRLPWDDFYFNTWFEAVDGYEVIAYYGGGAVIDSAGLHVTGSGSTGQSVTIRKEITYSTPALSWDKKRELKTTLRFRFNQGEEGYCLVGLGGIESQYFVGWVVEAGVLYGVVTGDLGPTRAQLEVLGVDWFDETRRLKIVYNPPSYVQFYVNDVLVATITTGLPTGDSEAGKILHFRIVPGTPAWNIELFCSLWSVWQEY